MQDYKEHKEYTDRKFIDKKTLCHRLLVSPKAIQKELEGAIKDGCGAVLKIGKSCRINYEGFKNYITNKNKEKEMNKQCQKMMIQKEYINGATGIGFIIPSEESRIADQLRLRINKRRL